MRKWWKKQNTSLKVAYIGGCFSIVVVILGMGSAIFTSIVQSKINLPRTELHNVSIEYTSFGGERFLYAENAKNSADKYDISTNTCLQLSIGQKIIKTQPNSNQWSGYINTLITTNLPMVIVKLELEVLDYQSVSSNVDYNVLLRQEGQLGGPGGFATTVNTNSILISPEKRTFDLILNQAYELPANGAVVFSTPVILTEPGTYVVKVSPKINNYSQIIKPNESLETLSINWVIIPQIDPTEIENPAPGTMIVKKCIE